VVGAIGLTNFDTAHVKQFVEGGVPVVSNQVTALCNGSV
jgi:hypothetical protein